MNTSAQQGVLSVMSVHEHPTQSALWNWKAVSHKLEKYCQGYSPNVWRVSVGELPYVWRIKISVDALRDKLSFCTGRFLQLVRIQLQSICSLSCLEMCCVCFTPAVDIVAEVWLLALSRRVVCSPVSTQALARGGLASRPGQCKRRLLFHATRRLVADWSFSLHPCGCPG
jgi:hypothetical protein